MTIRYGMAQWQHPAWVGWLYPSAAPSVDRLSYYAKFFSCVEMGSTFYTNVDQSQLLKWHGSVPESFNFSFKVSRQITHQLSERPWLDIQSDWAVFMESLQALGGKLGPTMLQFPSVCDELSLDKILALCDQWCLPSPLSVEVRHINYFDKSTVEQRLLSELSERKVNRVIMDSRPVFSTKAYCESLQDAQKKKPRVPCHPIATAMHPVVRFIGHPDLERNAIWLDQWAVKLVQWLREGREPSVFVHSSDNVAAPVLAATLDEKVAGLFSGYQACLSLPEVQSQIDLL